MFEIFKGDPLEFIVLFACFYGLGSSEIAGLKWDVIDLQTGEQYYSAHSNGTDRRWQVHRRRKRSY
jgi:integrase